MTAPKPDHGALSFAEKLLTLLDEGSFTATYKFALLLALMDLCLEQSTKSGAAPSSVTTRQLALKVLEMYWPHTVEFGDDRVLVQNRPTRRRSGGQAAIVTAIQRFRDRHAQDPSAPLSRARLAKPRAFETLVEQIEWKLVEMPLPRLQQIGGEDVPFIYRINWDRSITKAEFRDPVTFDNAIRFVGDAGEHLVRLTGLLRPLIQRQWAAMVARFNRDLVQDAELERFLFGARRINLTPVREGLLDLQDGRCFYCDRRLRQDAQIDHFVPWARYPNNAIENLVASHEGCNRDKGDHLAAAGHVSHWSERLADHADLLHQLADEVAWEADAARCLGVARSIYLRLPSDARLWAARGQFAMPDRATLKRVLTAA